VGVLVCSSGMDILLVAPLAGMDWTRRGCEDSWVLDTKQDMMYLLRRRWHRCHRCTYTLANLRLRCLKHGFSQGFAKVISIFVPMAISFRQVSFVGLPQSTTFLGFSLLQPSSQGRLGIGFRCVAEWLHQIS